MFTGEYRHYLDDKSRVILPAKMRKELRRISKSSKAILSKGFDGCLFLSSHENWERYVEEINKMRDLQKEIRSIKRHFTSAAFESAIDKQGRLLIPQILKDFGKIKSEVVMIGVFDRIEIWDPKLWKVASSNVDIEKIAETLSGKIV